MYHPLKLLSSTTWRILSLAVAFAMSATATMAAQAIDLASNSKNNQQVEENKTLIPVAPRGKFYKHRPAQVMIYQYDSQPLAKRAPLLIVHGLRAEYYPFCRWEKVIKRLKSNAEFSSKFKIYLARYDSTIVLDKVVPQMRAQIAKLYQLADSTPIVILTISMGGNMVYESMLDPQTDKQIKLVLAMGTPFHGSPLFSADWLQYGIYKNLSSPFTRIDHSLAYRLYFAKNANLLQDLRWDNCDGAIPDIGQFASRLPFGPSGNLVTSKAINQELAQINKKNFDKNKLITYSGYLINPYQLPEAARFMENAITAPATLLTVVLPAHCGREHPVLKMLNRQISTVVTTQSAATRAKTNFVYVLNDGITPLISALFLPDRYCASETLSREIDLPKIKTLTDVHTARIFRNIDHLTFLDGRRPIVALPGMRDELNPEIGSRDIFSWMLYDLDCAESDNKQAQLATYN